MKKHIELSAGIWLLLMALFLTACGAEQVQLFSEASYADVAIDEQIEQANIIFAGTVTNISKTLWNQDSGEYWEEVVKDEGGETLHVALPYYTIELVVDQPIVNTQKGETLVVTVIGTSPLEEQQASSKYSLQVGSEVVIFLRRSEMAWRDGKRPILQLMSAPEKSCFLRGDDGLYQTAHQNEGMTSLDKLMARIERRRAAQERPVVIQP